MRWPPTQRDSMKALNRTVGRLVPPRWLAKRYAGIPGRVHADDLMLQSEAPEHLAHYVSDAQSAIENITASLVATGRSWDDVGTFLDMPSGYGRVTRLLVQHLPPSRVTACDIDRRAVRFCVAEFGVQGLVAQRDPARTRFPSHYDVAFVGSLLTHLPEAAVAQVLRVVVAALAPRGLLLFTTQGVSCLEHLDWYGPTFKRREQAYRDAVATRGVCFMPYPGNESYGIAIHEHSYVEQLMATTFETTLTCVRFAQRGWDNHQDVWTYQRTPARRVAEAEAGQITA
jgi:SAM-dependent methyltransferase